MIKNKLEDLRHFPLNSEAILEMVSDWLFCPSWLKPFYIYKKHVYREIYRYIYFIKYPAETKTWINHSLKLKGYTYIINRHQNMFTEEQ